MPTSNKTIFYEGFIMRRGDFKPQDFGVDKSKEDFLDEMNNCFNDYMKDVMSLDEMLLRPDLAKNFCLETRARTRYFDLPDDIILRSVMMRRKNPVK